MPDRPTILIIDDDADIRELMKILLESAGYRVKVAADGSDALDQLRTGARPALIILDLMMPRLDGEQFLKRIRAGRLADVPVVILSGHSVAEQKAGELHVACCLMKPVEVTDLLKTVRHFAPNRFPL